MKKSTYLKISCIVLFLFGLIGKSNSQNLSLQWFKSFKGKDWDIVHSLIKEKKNIYFAGSFSDKISNLSDSLYTKGESDLLYGKLNTEGKILNFKSEGGKKFDNGLYLYKADTNSLSIWGVYTDFMSVKKDSVKTLGFRGVYNLNISKDSVIKSFKSVNLSGFSSEVYFASNKEYTYIAGSYNNYLVIENDTFVCKGKNDAFVVRVNKNGKVDKKYIIATVNDEKIQALEINGKEIIIAGSFNVQINLKNKKINAKGGYDIFITSLDDKLKCKWLNTMGGYYDDIATVIKTDTLKNIYFSGLFDDAMFVNTDTIVSKGWRDIFLFKYNENGEKQWLKTIGSVNDDNVNDVFILKNEIFLTGNFKGQINIGKNTLKSQGGADIFIAKLNQNGEVIYGEKIGGTTEDYIKKIIVDESHFLYLTGGFNSNITMISDSLTNSYVKDIFISQLFDCDYGEKINLTSDTIACDKIVLEAPSGFNAYKWNQTHEGQSLFIDTTGIYHIEAKDKRGCISHDSIKVVINKKPSLQIGNDTVLCKGNDLNLYASGNFTQILWNTKDTTTNISISESGIYSVIAKSIEGCENKDTVKVQFNPTPYFTLPTDTTICQNNLLTVRIENIDSISFVWNNGITEPFINIENTGLYSLIATNQYNCSYKDSTNVIMKPFPTIELGENKFLSDSEIVILRPGIFDNYLWNNGSNDSIMLISEKQLTKHINYFEVEVTNNNGCKAKDSIYLYKSIAFGRTQNNQNITTIENFDNTTINKTIVINENEKYNYGIYPNPTVNQLYIGIYSETTKEIKIKVMNEQSQLVGIYTLKLSNGLNTLKIDVQNKAKGSYTILSDEIQLIEKIIKM